MKNIKCNKNAFITMVQANFWIGSGSRGGNLFPNSLWFYEMNLYFNIIMADYSKLLQKITRYPKVMRKKK